ncbi:MAG: tetratricopeptide repeat protein, partial [Pseudomonadota bacterium]
MNGARIKSIIFVLSALFLVFSCGFSPEDRYYDEAMRYKAEGEVSKSIDSFKKAIATAPKSNTGKESLYMLGEMYYQTGDYKKAQRIFKLCIDLMDLGSKRKFTLLNKMAWIGFAKLNEQEQALKYYIKALDYASSKEERFDVFLGMGNCYLKIYKFDLATEYFDKAVKEYEKSKSEEMIPK